MHSVMGEWGEVEWCGSNYSLHICTVSFIFLMKLRDLEEPDGHLVLHISPG